MSDLIQFKPISTYIEKKTRLDDKYVTPGNRVYVIGTQDGLFPDFGNHITGEMGGVWSHPIKWLDGFFIGIESGSKMQWPLSTSFRTYPFYTEQHYDNESHYLIRRQFVPDDLEALIVTFEFTNRLPIKINQRFKCVFKSDLRPGWLGTEKDGVDHAIVYKDHIVINDSENPWFVCIDSDDSNAQIVLNETECPFKTEGNGTAATIEITREIESGATTIFNFYITGSMHSQKDAERTLEEVRFSSEELFARKERRYKTIDKTTEISIPNEGVQRSIRWVKYNTDWLTRTVPSIGNGLGAGLPEYPWWFGCDNGYALLGALPLGMFKLSLDTLRLLAKVSENENGNGQVIHEVSSTGIVYNPGNIQETPQFCRTVWNAFTWTGDLKFLEELYPFIKKAINWIITQADEDGLAVGYGIMEVEGLNVKLIDTAVYTQQAFEAYAKMADLFGDYDIAEEMRRRAERLKKTILRSFWLEDEGLYADVLGPCTLMNNQLEKWAVHASKQGNLAAASRYRELIDQTASNEAIRAYSLKNWVISTPLEVGMSPQEHAELVLKRMRTPEFRGAHGLYLSGIDQNRMMTISTSVQAVAECRYGNPDEAMRWLELMANSQDLRMPGSITEMSPDYGCFVQAWTVYGMVYPIVCQMFGVTPLAHENSCSIALNMPSEWHTALIHNLHMGNNTVSLKFERKETAQLLDITTEKEWTFHFASPIKIIASNLTIEGIEHQNLKLKLPAGTELTLEILNA